jgi:hypothetical protein
MMAKPRIISLITPLIIFDKRVKVNKPKPTPKPALKDCAAKRKTIECAKDNKLQIFLFAARATSN